MFEKLENGDFSDLSDLSDVDIDEDEDEIILENAERMENDINLLMAGNNENDGDTEDIEVDELEVENEDPEEEEEEANNENRSDVFQATDKKSIKWTKRNILESFDQQYEEVHNNENELEEILQPLEYFKRYITDGILEEMVDKTNLYAHQQNLAGFIPTNKDEIETFLGLHVMMGCLRFPRISMYWEKVLGIGVFLENMTRNRFYKLRTNLHLVNNLGKDTHNKDRFHKVRPIFNAVRKRCLDLEREQKLCVDEQICPFKGQLNVKQYVKGKPTPWGIKLFIMCGESGLIYDFLLYQGKTTELEENLQTTFGQGAAIVIHLSQSVTSPYSELYFDNYFSSYNLFRYLKSKQIKACGTVRMNRFSNPPFSSDKDLLKQPRGHSEELFSKDNDVVLTKWVDNKVVNIASNFVGIGETDTAKRWNKDSKEYVDVVRPEVIRKYNASMGGVDKLDFLIKIYRIFIRSRKWTLRLIFHAIDMAICNSWLEYKRDCKKMNINKKHQLDLLHFKLDIGNHLVKQGKPNDKRKVGRPSLEELREHQQKKSKYESRPSSGIRLDSVDHLPVHCGQKESGRCKKEGCKSGRSHFICNKCNVHLCLGKQRNCFFEFHTQK